MAQVLGSLKCGVLAFLAAGVGEAAAQGLSVQAQPAWNELGNVVGRVVVQAPGNPALVLASGVRGDLFGFAVVAVADVNGDGVEDVAVAAPLMVGEGDRHGCVYVHSGADGQKIATLWGQPGERFGTGLDVAADADADGVSDLRVGIMGGASVDPESKPRLVDAWRTVSSATGVELASGMLADLPVGVVWHAVADDELGMTGVIRDASSADLDADGTVGEQDFLRLVELVGQSRSSGAVDALGDVNGDGAVNDADITALVGAVGLPSGGTSWATGPCNPRNPDRPTTTICWRPVTGGGGDDPGPGSGGDGSGGGGGGGGGDDPFDPDPDPGCPDCPGDGGGGGGGDVGDGEEGDGSNLCDIEDTDGDGIRDDIDCDDLSPSPTIGCCEYASPWGRRENDPEDLECWDIHKPLVDIDADTDNSDTVTNAPDRNQTEERLEQVPDAIGKVVLINDNDDDSDGITDYADGFDRDGLPDTDDEETSEEAFTPIVVRLTCAAVQETRDSDDDDAARVVFYYTDSDPSDVQVQFGANGPTYTLAPGRLRLWTKDGSEERDPREVDQGGDWIKPGEAYSIEDLGYGPNGGTVTFYAEGIAPGRELVGVSLGRFIDQVPLSVIGYRFVRATESGAGEVVAYPEVSHPSPMIDGRIVRLVDVAPSADGAHIEGTLWFVGEVRDALCDQVPGAGGSISELRVLLNGQPVRYAGGELSSVQLSVTKQQQQSLIQPYPYRGAFNRGLERVRLRPGINSLRLEATNSMGFTGFYERAFEVTWENASREQFEVSIQRLLHLQGDGDLEVSWAFEGPLGLRTGQALLAQVDANTWSGSGGDVHVEFDEAGIPIAATVQLVATDGLGDLPAWTREALPIEIDEQNSNIWRATESREPPSLDWLQHNFGVITHPSESSQGGFINPYLIELLGPSTEAIEKVEGMHLDGESYVTITLGERTFLAREGLGRPSVFLVLRDARELDTLIREQDGPRRDGAVNFVQGLAAGLYDTGESNVVGLWEMGELIVNANLYVYRHYNPITITWRFIESGNILLTDDAATLKAGITALGDIADSAAGLVTAQGDALYRAILLGDTEAMNKLDGQWQDAAKLSVEMLTILGMALDDADDFEKGRVVGMVIGEVLLAVPSGGASTATRANVIPRVAQKLRQLQRISSNPVAMQRLDTLLAGVLLLGRIQSQAAQTSWAVVKPFIDALDGDKLRGLKAAISGTRDLAARNKLLEGIWEVAYALDDSHIADAMSRAPGQRHVGFPSFRDYPRNLGGSWLEKAGLNRHHGFPVEYSQKLNSDGLGFPVIDPDDTPCMLLTKDHNGNAGGTDAFHAILDRLDREFPPTDVNRMVANLRQAYQEFGCPDMIHVVEDWLRANGRMLPP